MTNFAQYDSGCDDNEDLANLQLFSLRVAKKYWEELEKEYKKDPDQVDDLKERCVFITATLGLSVSQLLGQNDPDPQNNKVRSPKEIFQAIAKEHSLDEDIIIRFKAFIKVYDMCRHFGTTVDGSRHNNAHEMTFEKIEEYYKLTIDIWNAIIKIRDECDDSNAESIEKRI